MNQEIYKKVNELLRPEKHRHHRFMPAVQKRMYMWHKTREACESGIIKKGDKMREVMDKIAITKRKLNMDELHEIEEAIEEWDNESQIFKHSNRCQREIEEELVKKGECFEEVDDNNCGDCYEDAKVRHAEGMGILQGLLKPLDDRRGVLQDLVDLFTPDK